MNKNIPKKVEELRNILNKIWSLQFKNKKISEELFKKNKASSRRFYDHCNEVRDRLGRMIEILEQIKKRLKC